jgi:hypothetical protein
METLGNKQATEEIRVTLKIDALEKIQTLLAGTLGSLVDGINSVRDDAKKKASELKEGIKEFKNDVKKETSELKEEIRLGLNLVKNDARREASNARKEASALQEGLDEVKYNATKEAFELKEMMRKLINKDSNSTRHTPVTSTEKRKHDAKTPSTNPEEKEMASPDHRKQRQHNENMDPPSNTVPLAINFEEVIEDIDMDTGGNENNAASSINSMCTAETPTVLEEEISITGHDFTNNDMDYTDSPIPTTITATTQSNGEFTPVLNGSPNRQSSLERRNTATTTNNCYSALQTTSTTKESNNNNTTNPSAKDRQDYKND